MLTIDLAQFNTYITALLPMIVACIAGVIRQDRLPSWTNELITVCFILIAACIQAFGDGKLGGSPLADFTIVAGYTAAVLHTPLFQQLQGAIQANVVAIGKPKPPVPTVPTLDQVLAQMTAQQRQMLIQQNTPMPAMPGATTHVDQYPTQTSVPVPPVMPFVQRGNASASMPPTQGG